MTSFPASVYNLKGRGLIKEGMTADIAIFNENKIKEEVDFKNPKKYSSSFEYTIVAGEVAVEKAKVKTEVKASEPVKAAEVKVEAKAEPIKASKGFKAINSSTVCQLCRRADRTFGITV